MQEVIQGPGETLYMPGNLAHAILNIEENISVTENYFLDDSLDDWIHGMMIGDMLLADDSDGTDEKIFWKYLYYKHLNKTERKRVRSMINQVESRISKQAELCDDTDEEDAYDLEEGQDPAGNAGWLD